MKMEKELMFDGEEDQKQEDQEFDISEYDLTSLPNDFNVTTINSYLESGSIKIPGFQRNYVWDLKRASKLVESIILGLPVPQIFLYEEKRNQFLVIDGQQRLMTILFFMKGRFPKKEKRTEIRRLFNENDKALNTLIFNDEYFSNFNLALPSKVNAKKNPFNTLNYNTLDTYKMQFDLRPIRCVVVKQNVPKDDNSSVFEIFNRLNTGGINLMPQEIRCSLYHSDFIDMIVKLNLNSTWRKFLRTPDPDLHMKDVEILLRSFAIAVQGDTYKSSMAKFLNDFASDARKFTQEYVNYLELFAVSLFKSIADFPADTFINKKSGRFNTFLLEGVMYAQGKLHFKKGTVPTQVDVKVLNTLAEDSVFISNSIQGTTNKDSVDKRLERAEALIR
jgi:hypothetical protein